jgi:hypothetical protein
MDNKMDVGEQELVIQRRCEQAIAETELKNIENRVMISPKSFFNEITTTKRRLTRS